jgi:hypothetical protein
LFEGNTLGIELDDTVEIHFCYFVMEGFSDKVRIGSEDFDIDHRETTKRE